MTGQRIRIVVTVLSSMGVLLVLQPAARADMVMVQMHLTSAGSDVSNSVYISPYYATINGGPVTPVICDDFRDDSYVPESWTATVYAGSANLSGTRMAQLSGFTGDTLNRAYDAVDYLALELPGANATDRALISFAIWDIFASSYVSAWVNDTAFYSAVHADALAALQAAPVNGRYNLTIYSSPISDISCGGGTCQNTPPQEFVTTPEATAPAILAFDLLALLGVAFLVRRSIPRNA